MTKPRKLAVGIGAASALCALLAWSASGFASFLLAWASVSCLISTYGYLRNRPGVYGKREGRLIWWRALPTAVFVGAFRIACALMRAWRRHPAKSQVTDGVWVAGRVEGRDLPDALDYIVDLVSEFPEPAEVRGRSAYRFLPVLDGGIPPSAEPVLRLLDEVGAPTARVLVHCDSGMGRAPTFAALLLLQRGEADDVADAIAKIERARPFIHLGSADRAFLAEIAPRIRRPVPHRTAAAS